MFDGVTAPHLHEPQHCTGPCRQCRPRGPRRRDAVNRIGHHVTAGDELIGGDPLGNDVTHRVVPVGHLRRPLAAPSGSRAVTLVAKAANQPSAGPTMPVPYHVLVL
jgi:hypothetical protein